MWADSRGNQYVVLTNFGANPIGPFELDFPPEADPEPTMALWAPAHGMALESVHIRRDSGRATVTLPGIGAAGVLLLLRDADPITSVVPRGTDKYDTALPVLRPGQKAVLQITVYNPSRRPAAALSVRLYTLRGWFRCCVSVNHWRNVKTVKPKPW